MSGGLCSPLASTSGAATNKSAFCMGVSGQQSQARPAKTPFCSWSFTVSLVPRATPFSAAWTWRWRKSGWGLGMRLIHHCSSIKYLPSHNSMQCTRSPSMLSPPLSMSLMTHRGWPTFSMQTTGHNLPEKSSYTGRWNGRAQLSLSSTNYVVKNACAQISKSI